MYYTIDRTLKLLVSLKMISVLLLVLKVVSVASSTSHLPCCPLHHVLFIFGVFFFFSSCDGFRCKLQINFNLFLIYSHIQVFQYTLFGSSSVYLEAKLAIRNCETWICVCVCVIPEESELKSFLLKYNPPTFEYKVHSVEVDLYYFKYL